MPGKTTPLEDKKRIIAAHQRGEDAILLGRQLGVKSRTTYNIIRTCEQRGGVIAVPRGGARHTKVTDEMKQVLEDIISENCTLSLREINENLQIRLPNAPKIGKTTIATTLEGLFFTLKKVTITPFERNSQSVKDARRENANWFFRKWHFIFSSFHRRNWL